MNHLGDTNKMVDTPRTEAEVNRSKCWSDDLITIDANFACQLERELAAANGKIELLMSANADVARIAGERDAAEKRIRLLIAERDTARLQTDQKHSLREEFRELLGTDDIEVGVAVVREMRYRIKRLEDAYAAKDQQLSNLLHICRDNDIEVSSYDLIHGRKP